MTATAHRIVVFGATGASGQELVRQALAAGHHVRAFVRDPTAMTIEHERLEIASGDVYDQAAVDEAVCDRDAVIGMLGIRRGAPKTLVGDGTERILSAMRKHGVPRYLGVSAYGARETRDGSAYARLTWALLRPNLEDKERHERLIAASDLDWTLVRPPRLTNGPGTRRWRVGTDVTMRMSSKIARADVAAFLLAQLDDDTWMRKAPAIVAR